MTALEFLFVLALAVLVIFLEVLLVVLTVIPVQRRSGIGRRARKASPPKRIACTYCGGTSFYTGPSGGVSVNVLCANRDCRHWFNDQGPFGLDDLKRVEPLETIEAKS